MTKRIKLFLGIVILIIIFSFMGKYLFENWQQVPFQELRFNYALLITSFLIYACCFILGGFIWKTSLSFVGENLSLIKSLRISAFSYMARYVPGKIWGIIGQVWFTKKEGNIPGEKSGVCIVVNTVISILSSLLLALIIFPLILESKFSEKFYLLFILIPLFFIILYPPIFMRIVNFGLRKLKREKIKTVPKYTQILELLLLYTFGWVLTSSGIYFLISSFYPIKSSFFIPLCGIYPGAWVIGFLSLVTPGGLGVREGVLSYFLSFYMPVSVGIITSIIVRIWTIIGEFAFFAIFARGIKKYIT
ncbi:MAG: lysylphosphatidylglycerol synthase transmembrane domain-containing protein [bacterium]|nr:lysylphosphatidylglycerol synthase transmembrane domain-containing protein [bacterium]